MFKRKIKLPYYVLIVSVVNVLLYNLPFFAFVRNNIELNTFNGALLLSSLVLTAILLNLFLFYIGLYLLRKVGKWLLVLFFNFNAICVYFITNLGTMMDRSMMGNVMQTNYEEASSFLSFSLVLYLIFLGILPSILIYRLNYVRVKLKTFLLQTLFLLIALITVSYINAPNWLWIDKNSKKLGAIIMPWSYVINTIRFYHNKHSLNQKQQLLPTAQITNDKKAVFVLVIGESARSANFSLYGYTKKTNPLLAKVNDLQVYQTNAAATYTTAGVKAILDYKKSSALNEILPNYLERNGVDVIWRTTNWGEPKVNTKNYQNKEALQQRCQDTATVCTYDEVLLHGLNDLILKSQKNKVLIVLHTSTSHGPTYFKKYPPEFEQFTPVCKSVELSNCTDQELINAYDNTILYTDYLIAKLIENLKHVTPYTAAMFYVSDHGESLGENNLYMHGIPLSLAPKEQVEIPFIAWTSDDSVRFKNQETATQYHVFHSVLDFLGVESPIYDKEWSLFEK